MLPENLILEQFEIGPLNNFLYILGDQETKEGALVDPAWDVPFLIHKAEDLDLTITSIFLTHTHPDHIQGLDQAFDHYRVPIYVHEAEAGQVQNTDKTIHPVSSQDKLQTGRITWGILHLPGHSPGSQGFLHKNILIAGDCVFIDGCGRCDLPGSDPRAQYQSLYHTIMTLPDETIIYPGHHYGPAPYDTLAHQKDTNPYLTCRSEQEFLQTRMGLTA